MIYDTDKIVKQNSFMTMTFKKWHGMGTQCMGHGDHLYEVSRNDSKAAMSYGLDVIINIYTFES